MFEPSTASAYALWKTPPAYWKPLTHSFNFRLMGKFMYFGSKTLTMALHVSLITCIQQTVEQVTLNKCATVRCSHGMARTLSVIATRYSTDIAVQSLDQHR